MNIAVRPGTVVRLLPLRPNNQPVSPSSGSGGEATERLGVTAEAIDVLECRCLDDRPWRALIAPRRSSPERPGSRAA